MQKFESPVGVLDIVSISRQHDATLVVPHLGYALEYWAIVKTAFTELVGQPRLTFTKTAIIDKSVHHILRLWVPYKRDPTMPMDFPHHFKNHCDFVSPYFTKGELRALVGDI